MHNSGLAVGMGLGVIAASAVAWWVIRRLNRSLKHQTRTSDAYSQEIRQHIDELTTERNQATAVLESMAEGVIAVDLQGRVLLMNPAAGMLLGVAPQSSIGRSLYEAVRNHELHELTRGLLRDHQRVTKDTTLLQPNERILRVQGVPCQGDGPSGLRAVFVLQDVTEHHRYEQLRKEFVANVSHELKTPLTTIRSLTETLLEGALDDPANNRRFVQLIDHDADRLSRLIDDLLVLSQVESQAVPLNLAHVELLPLVDSVLAAFQPGIEQRRLRVTTQLPPHLAVRADPDRMKQVLLNLIDNAIKYNTDGGEITISAVREGSSVSVIVADTGVGIPEQDLPRVFERFYRVEKSRSRELGGTGLGLSIVKHIVEAHGGRVAVHSQVSQGSTFSVTLPLSA